ncbi:MAG: septal ring lytic transglycosylase RlpA family protein [Chitinophagaceae bacterium]|nr:septal ring lytic transglycosylase RlpA family protein [Chitinophagaceae bacterium]
MRLFLTSVFVCLFLFLCFQTAQAQDTATAKTGKGKAKIQYGIASFYSNKFNGRKTANGEIFSQQKFTAAHNSLPLGTYVRVTNLRNKRTVIVKVNDRLHARNKRLIDLTKAAAQKLGFIKAGLVRVKIEVLGKKPPSSQN